MTQPVRIPADFERPDAVLANLNARQLLILAVTGIVLYGAFSATRSVVPLPVFLIVAVPVGGAAALLALGRRDGMSLDRLVLAAARQRLTPRYQVAAPEGIHRPPAWLADRVTETEQEPARQVCPAALRLPAEGVTEAGVIDLGRDGFAVVAVCSTINFALRTPTEQETLVAAFGRYLHSLTAPVQILVRAERLDLSAQIAELRDSAPALPHPALEVAAREHADYLTQLANHTELLRRQVLLILRETLSPTPRRKAAPGTGTTDQAARRAAEARLMRRVDEAVELLGPVGITVTALDPGQATAVLAAACNPDSFLPPSSALAGANEVITTVTPPMETTSNHRALTTADQAYPGMNENSGDARAPWEHPTGGLG